MSASSEGAAAPRSQVIETFASVALDMTAAEDEATLLRIVAGAPRRVLGHGRFEFVREGGSGDEPVPGSGNGPVGYLRPVDMQGNGEVRTLLASVARLAGVCLIALRQRDLNQRLQQGLSTDRAYFEQLFSHAPEAIVVLDQDDRVVRVNFEFERLFGHAAADAEGRTINELIVPEDQQQTALNLTRAVADGRTVQEESVRRRADGSLVHVSILGTPIIVNDRQVGVYGIYRDITAQKETEEALRRLSTTDDLTGLYNRRGFFLLAEQQRRLAIRKKAELLLLYIDIDDFKSINDTHGHLVGDRVLSDIGALLRRCYRDSDILARMSEGVDLLARMGGDEFVVLAVDAGVEGERILLDRLRERLAEYNDSVAAEGFRVALSVGAVRVAPEPGTSIDAILAAADRLMYEEKRSLTSI